MLVARLQPEECGIGTQTVIEKIQVSSDFVVPGLLRFVFGGGAGVGILACIGEHFVDKVFVGCAGRTLYGFQNLLFCLPHHVVFQAGLQQVGEHLDVVSARTVALAHGCIDVAPIVLEVILKGKLRQQLQVILVDGTVVARLYGERRFGHHRYFFDNLPAPYHFSFDTYRIVHCSAGVVGHLHLLIIQAQAGGER